MSFGSWEHNIFSLDAIRVSSFAWRYSNCTRTPPTLISCPLSLSPLLSLLLSLSLPFSFSADNFLVKRSGACINIHTCVSCQSVSLGFAADEAAIVSKKIHLQTLPYQWREGAGKQLKKGAKPSLEKNKKNKRARNLEAVLLSISSSFYSSKTIWAPKDAITLHTHVSISHFFFLILILALSHLTFKTSS